MSLINCKNLTVAYEGKTVLSNLNFEIEKGWRVFVIGENGSGKTTLMQTMLGLKKPLEGKIIYGDGLKHNDIGYLPQQREIKKDFPASVYEVVLSGRLNKCGLFYTKKDKQAALESMAKLDILDLKNNSFKDLSGGQQQRVLLARALCATNKILMLDEPLTGLDSKTSAYLSSLLLDLNTKHEITLIIISHNFESTMNLSTHILHLNDNQVFFGTTKDYKKTTYYKLMGGKW